MDICKVLQHCNHCVVIFALQFDNNSVFISLILGTNVLGLPPLIQHPLIYHIPSYTTSHHIPHPLIYHIPSYTTSTSKTNSIINQIPSFNTSPHMTHPVIYNIPHIQHTLMTPGENSIKPFSKFCPGLLYTSYLYFVSYI